ncbi:MAG: tripartite tricarboxylate transporter substrate binding protein [Variibacter sp.]|nr:tripartite tricarboxylate transporter substrate binding protein [Variibacter sp.]
MKLTRRHFVAGAVATAGLAAAGRPAVSQSKVTIDGWPSRPVRTIVPSGAGGPAENYRIYADHFREVFGQAFLLENQPGASGAIGSLNVARAAPDGYTLLCAANSHVLLAPLVAPKPAFDVRKAFTPIGLLISYPFCLIVNADLPVKTIPELVAYAKERPGQLNFGSIGIGTGGHLVAELFCKRAGIQAVHIPYTGAPAQVQGVASGALHFTIDTIGNSRGAEQAGKVRQIAVTGSTRSEAAPHLPTFAEEGFPGFELLLWLGVFGPAGLPPAIVSAINREIARCSQKPEVKERLLQAAYSPAEGSAEDFAALIDRELALWSSVVRETGVKIPA